MKGFWSYVLLTTLSLAVSGTTTAFAGDEGARAAQPGNHGDAQFNELAPGRERGITFTEILPPVMNKPPVVPAAVPKAKPVVHTAASRVSAPRVAHPAATAKKAVPPRTGASTNVATPAVPEQPVKESTPPPLEQPTVVTVSRPAPAANGSVITAWLDKPGMAPKYRVGEKLVINVTASYDCNVVVFNYDAKGTLTQIFPNDFQPTGLLRAGENMQIGGPDSPFDYEVAGKGGSERIFVYAYPITSEQPLAVAMNPLPNTPFRSTEMTIEQYRDLVNKSKVFFSREVKITPKKAGMVTPAAATAPANSNQPNKIELTFQVEAGK